MTSNADIDALERVREALEGLRAAARAAEAAGVAVRLRTDALPLASPARVRAIVDGMSADAGS